MIKSNFHPAVLYSFYLFSSLLMLYLLSLIYRRFKAIHHTLSVILTNVDSSRNLKKCAKVLNNLLLVLSFLFTAMLFPFAIFAFNLDVWTNLIPFALLLISIYFVKSLVALIDGHSSYVPSYGSRESAAKF